MNLFTDDFIAAQNRPHAEALTRDYATLGDQLARTGTDIEAITARAAAFAVAVPSWGVGSGGTRFARFPGSAEPRNVFEKLEDCAVIQRLVRCTPRVSPHFPWDCVDDYAALVLPGGVANPDALRMDETAVAFARDFLASGRPLAAICHAPWTLVEAGVVDGRTLTSWPSLRTDITNAGGSWKDERVVIDGNLITSRKPDDLPAFNSALLEALQHGAAGTS